MSYNIGIIGFGSFGGALALALLKNSSNRLFICCRSEKDIKKLLLTAQDKERILFSRSLQEVVRASEMVLVCVPSYAIQEVYNEIAQLNCDCKIVICSKGITNLTIRCIKGEMRDLAFLSGPSFADEIVKGASTLVSVAGKKEIVEMVKDIFLGTNIETWFTQDAIGVQLCGSYKNIIAIGMGLIEGVHKAGNKSKSVAATIYSVMAGIIGKGSDSTVTNNLLAAFLVKMIDELKRLILAAGGSADTLLQPAGIGDIFLSCTGQKSRNKVFGVKLGREVGKVLILQSGVKDLMQNKFDSAELTKALNIVKGNNFLKEKLVEGCYAIKPAYDLCKQLGVEAPILFWLHDVLLTLKLI